MKTRNTAILIFDDVEVLDFAGPYEVFNVANEAMQEKASEKKDSIEKAFNVFTVSEIGNKILARNGLQIIPDYSIQNCPRPDILIVPGGNGRKTVMHNTVITGWIKEKSEDTEHLLSVCTGAFILGKAGVLDGLNATTHYHSYDEFADTFPRTKLVKGVKFSDNGKIITAAGISAGINMSLHVVDRLLGNNMGRKTAQYMEYDY
jgi:transcriptional regulator GlxA family with amidase domain